MRCAAGDERFWIPAVQVNVVDPVGAGNAYCGALLVGWLETQSLLSRGAIRLRRRKFPHRTGGPPSVAFKAYPPEARRDSRLASEARGEKINAETRRRTERTRRGVKR
ncbi:MAG: hypothetical protein IPK16_08280 [Anaerolineales bacterium]|nr:hypothetical protein [Anaerolineales bacterium]